jgi:hypothetical protein
MGREGALFVIAGYLVTGPDLLNGNQKLQTGRLIAILII